jgi:aspartyl protease family protein
MQKLLYATIAFGSAVGLIMPAEPPTKQAGTEARAEAPIVVRSAADASAPPADPPLSSETRLEKQANGHFYVDAEVNGGQLVHFLVDTGSSGVALTVDDAHRLGVAFSPAQFRVIGSGASGDVRGQLVTLSRVAVQGKEVRDVPGAVVEGLGTSLLGQSYLSRIASVEMNRNTMTLR